MKKISIITINYNNAHGLERTIKSVVGQLECDMEFIIIDGGSTDGSVDLIKTNALNVHYWVSEKDCGIYHAQNKGTLKATGEYCLVLNSGDVFANEMVLNNFGKEMSGEDIIYGNIITRNKDGIETYLTSPEKLDVSHFIISTLWHPSAFIKRNLFDKFGFYNESFKITGDYEFFIRVILKFNASTKYLKKPVCIFDLGGVSNSADMVKLQLTERKKSWELNFSKILIETFEKHTQLKRSREYKLGKLVINILGPFLK